MKVKNIEFYLYMFVYGAIVTSNDQLYTHAHTYACTDIHKTHIHTSTHVYIIHIHVKTYTKTYMYTHT